MNDDDEIGRRIARADSGAAFSTSMMLNMHGFSARALVEGKLVLVERENDRSKVLDFYRANNFKSWNTRHSARDGVACDQMLCNLGR